MQKCLVLSDADFAGYRGSIQLYRTFCPIMLYVVTGSSQLSCSMVMLLHHAETEISLGWIRGLGGRSWDLPSPSAVPWRRWTTTYSSYRHLRVAGPRKSMGCFYASRVLFVVYITLKSSRGHGMWLLDFRPKGMWHSDFRIKVTWILDFMPKGVWPLVCKPKGKWLLDLRPKGMWHLVWMQ